MVWLWILLVLLLLSSWQMRKSLEIVWKINGWLGVLEQPILWLLLLIFNNPYNLLEKLKWVKRHHSKTIAVILFDRMVLHVDDPVTMECVMNAPECQDKSYIQDGFFASKGLLQARGQKWKIRRKQLNPAFNYNILLSFFDTFNTVGNHLQQHIAFQLQCNAVKYTELEDLLTKAVLVISCQTTMGTEIGLMQKETEDIAGMYKRLLEISALRILRPWLQIDFIFRLLHPHKHTYYRRSNKSVEEFVSNIVKRKHFEWQTKSTTGNWMAGNHVDAAKISETEILNDDEPRKVTTQKRIFIEQIFHLAESGELTLDDIMDESYSMILVSFETVSNSIAIALLCLAMHPQYQRELREQIYQVFPDGRPECVTTEHLQQLKYLDMVINESLRLFSTVPISMRQASKDVQLRLPNVHAAKGAPANVIIPRGTMIALDVFNMQRNSKYWGPNAEQYNPPEHFADPRSKRHPYAFTPFSKGLRMCIGYQYSIFVTKILLIKLLAAFEFKTTTKLEDLQFMDAITLKFKNSQDIKFCISKVSPETHNNKL